MPRATRLAAQLHRVRRTRQAGPRPAAVEDLVQLLDEQLADPPRWGGAVLNVGGERHVILSLLETTALCAEITGNQLDTGSVAETRPGDVPLYISDCAAPYGRTTWRPRPDTRQTLADVHRWICEHEADLMTAVNLIR